MLDVSEGHADPLLSLPFRASPRSIRSVDNRPGFVENSSMAGSLPAPSPLLVGCPPKTV